MKKIQFDRFPYSNRPWHEVLFMDWIVPVLLIGAACAILGVLLFAWLK